MVVVWLVDYYILNKIIDKYIFICYNKSIKKEIKKMKNTQLNNNEILCIKMYHYLIQQQYNALSQWKNARIKVRLRLLYKHSFIIGEYEIEDYATENEKQIIQKWEKLSDNYGHLSYVLMNTKIYKQLKQKKVSFWDCLSK